jgi:hypothetical protein
MDSMKPEKPLVIDTAGGFGGSSATAVDTSSVPTPVQ